MRRLAALGAAAFVAAALPATAFAHAVLRHASPAYQARTDVQPRQVVLRFDQEVGIIPHTLEVTMISRTLAGSKCDK